MSIAGVAALLMSACAAVPNPWGATRVRFAVPAPLDVPPRVERIEAAHRGEMVPEIRTMPSMRFRRPLEQAAVVGRRHWQEGPGQATVDGAEDVSPIDTNTLPLPELAGFTFDMGAGIAPYDDRLPSYDLDPEGRPGFSDALMQLSWAVDVGFGAELVGTAAAARFQDVNMLDSLADAELSWVALGVRFRF